MSEIRALLLTDVVDSTQLTSQLTLAHGEAAVAQLWAGHDRVARDLLPRFGGREIDKTDGMLLMFERAGDALAYAQAYHAALAGLSVPLQARVGLHVGPVILRENAPEDVARGAKPLEVDGLAKPTAARVMALARGGQTLLSADAMQALAAQQQQVSAQSHGFWKMKGVDEPMELFEVGGALAATAPDGEKSYRVVRVGERWLPLKQVPNNLPEAANAFVGRERELDEIKTLLQDARLVTLLGMGGLGKTRLSLQVAAELRAEFPDGIWFLDLAPLRDGALVLAEAAQVLAVREEPGQPLLQTLCAQLKSRRLLIVLDNCEHLVQACASLAHALLKAAPDVRLLASSREALRVPGEQAYPILPLPLPGRGDSLAQLAASTAVRLFVSRAQAHKPGFELTPEQAPAVAELVTRLEGIPLALELAAARVRLLAVADINKRLGDRYKLLTGGDRVLQQRQQTLRALVDWSHELLSENEQLLFRRLGVFVGGFDLAAAEQVCAQEPLDPLDVMDLLGSLVEKSLVLMEERPEGARYRMLETLREYARDKLAQAGEEHGQEVAHGMYFFGLAKEIGRGMYGDAQPQWVARGEVEIDNLRAALAAALCAKVDPIIAVKFCYALQLFWMLRGYVREGREAVQAARARAEVQASELFLGYALYVDACLAQHQGALDEAAALLSQCLAIRRGLDRPFDLAATLSTQALVSHRQGHSEAAFTLEEQALGIFERLDDPLGQTVGHEHLARYAIACGDDERASRHIDAGLRLARAHQLQEQQAELLLHEGQLAFKLGDWQRSRSRVELVLELCRQSGNRRDEALAELSLARLVLASGESDGPGQASPLLAKALGTFSAQGQCEPWLDGLELAAVWAGRTGKNALLQLLIAKIPGWRESLRIPRTAYAEKQWQAWLAEQAAGLAGESEEDGTSLDQATAQVLRALCAP